MNKVVLLGRITKDPELRFAAGTGNAVCNFTLACNRPFKKDEADFIQCVAFGKTAETIGQYIVKGREMAISGSVRTGSYDKDGQKVYTTTIAVESFEFIGGNNSNNNNNRNNGLDGLEPVNDEDMPY